MLGFAGVEVSLALLLVSMSLTLMYKVSAADLPECIEIKISESQTNVAGMLDFDGDEDRDEDDDEIALSSVPYNLAMTTSETTPVATDSRVGTVGGLGMGESYTGSQMPVPNPSLEQSNLIMGAMSALGNDEQGFETPITNSTSELLPDTLDLTMDHVPMDHDLTMDMASLVRGNPVCRDTSLIGPDTQLNAEFNQDLENWWNSNMQSPSFNDNLEISGKRILSWKLFSRAPTRGLLVGGEAINSLTTLI